MLQCYLGTLLLHLHCERDCKRNVKMKIFFQDLL